LRRRRGDQDPAYEKLKGNDYGPTNKKIDKHRVYTIKIRRRDQRPTEENQTQAKDQYVKLMLTE